MIKLVRRNKKGPDSDRPTTSYLTTIATTSEDLAMVLNHLYTYAGPQLVQVNTIRLNQYYIDFEEMIGHEADIAFKELGLL